MGTWRVCQGFVFRAPFEDGASANPRSGRRRTLSGNEASGRRGTKNPGTPLARDVRRCGFPVDGVWLPASATQLIGVGDRALGVVQGMVTLRSASARAFAADRKNQAWPTWFVPAGTRGAGRISASHWPGEGTHSSRCAAGSCRPHLSRDRSGPGRGPCGSCGQRPDTRSSPC